MYLKLPIEESTNRLQRLFEQLNNCGQDWDSAIIIDRINLYYFTGTMPDGVLLLRRNGDVMLFVRRSYERSCAESPIKNIIAMNSYKDILTKLGESLGKTYIETEKMPIAMLNRIQKYLPIEQILSLDRLLLKTRSIKSAYELEFIQESGRQHNHVLTEIMPNLFKEGMSEIEMLSQLYNAMLVEGHQGLTRFAGFQTEVCVGQYGFGTSTLAATNFDGPGGMTGMSPLLPSIGSRERRLQKGDLIFIDIAYGYMGYQTDKTQVYSFKSRLPQQALDLHNQCIAAQRLAAEQLKPGNIPAQIYSNVCQRISPELQENFMGYGQRRVAFIGHGVGLYIDEYPVIAKGFDEPLAENMVVALEPKVGVSGVGTVGVEDTYLVTNNGGICLTGGGREVIEI